MTTAPLFAFLAGLSLGIGVCWGYIRILRGKIRLYETYIHERLDKQFAARTKTADTKSGLDEPSTDSPSSAVSPAGPNVG